jgi:chitinase
VIIMRRFAVFLAPWLAAAFSMGCSTSNDNPGGFGGTKSTDVVTSSGGQVGSGGKAGSGGQVGSGGKAGSGGMKGTGGFAGTGGMLDSGAGGEVDSGTGGTADSDGSTSPMGKIFVGYYQMWSETWTADGESTKLAKLPSYVNVVNLSFMQPDTTYVAGSTSLTGTGVTPPYDGPVLKAAVAALHKNQTATKVYISVGGATYFNWAGFKPENVAAFVNDFGLDGVDIDYEPGTANCTVSAGKVSCPSDAEFIAVVKSMRAALPRPKLLSIAAFSVGAYGEGTWANATPASAHTGIVLGVLKDTTAAAALDLVNVMSYDAGSTFDPIQALAAYQNHFKGAITMGIEVPPEAWGGHEYTIAEIDKLADAVLSSGAAGLMLWSVQKTTAAQQFATEICTKLGLSNCSMPMI